MFISKAWPDYCKERLTSMKIQKQYFKYVQDISQFTKKGFWKINSSDAYHFYNHIKLKYQNEATLNTIVRSLKSIGLYFEVNASRYKVNYKDPFHILPVKYTEVPYTKEDIPGKEIIDEFLAFADENSYINIYLAITVAYHCALSASELIVLTNKNFNFHDGNQLSLNVSGPQKRSIAIPIHVVTKIKQIDPDLFIHDESVPLFRKRNSKSKPFEQQSLRNLQYNMTKVSRALSYEYSLKDIRHAAVVKLLKAGNTKQEVADYTGIDVNWLFRYELLLSPTPEQIITIKFN